MKRNMKAWLSDMLNAETKKAMPVLSFPGASLLGIDVKELIFSADNQANAMAAVAKRVDSAAFLFL